MFLFLGLSILGTTVFLFLIFVQVYAIVSEMRRQEIIKKYFLEQSKKKITKRKIDYHSDGSLEEIAEREEINLN